MITSMLRRAQLSGCLATAEPNQVSGLTATASGQTTINLSWTADSTPSPNGATSYDVERSNDGLGSWSTIATGLTTNSYSDTSLSASQTRYYRVTSVNCFGGALASASANATTAAPSVNPPAAPSGLTATATSSTAISLSWTDNANNEDGFKVERSTDNTNWTEIVGNLAANSTSYSATGLTASTLYYFRVRAYNAGGNSAYTSSASATTQSGSLSPSWSLDFSTGTPSGYTLTRASTGTYVDSSGYVASASTDIARLTHNSSGSRLGLLVEGQRTNLAQSSAEFENAYWNGGTGTTAAGVTSPTAPDNSTDAAELTETTANSGHNKQRNSIAVTAGTVTWSAYVKKQSRQYVGVYVYTFNNQYGAIFDLNNNAAFSAARSVGTPNGSYGSENVGNGWYRIWVTMDTGGSGTVNTYPMVFLSDRAGFTGTLSDGIPVYTGSTSESVYVWGLQFETAATPSSYIPTTTASVTRSADLVHVLDSAITNWGDPGALVLHFYAPGQAGTLISTDDASTAQVGIEASTTTAARAFWSSGSTATGTIGTGVQKAVHYWNGSTSKFAINGGTVQSATNNLTIANTDFVTLGAEATESGGVPGTFSQYANCVIRKVEFYSGTLTDANLQTITT